MDISELIPGEGANENPGPWRYWAHFTPEAWLNNYAVAVDPEGETEWECTRGVLAELEYFNRLAEEDHQGWDEYVGILDNDDVLRGDPDAPEWVRRWSGPFSIHVVRRPAESIESLSAAETHQAELARMKDAISRM